MTPRGIALALFLASSVHLCVSASDTRAPTTADTFAQSGLVAGTRTSPAIRLSGRLPTVGPDLMIPAFVASTPLVNVEVASLPRKIASLPQEVATPPWRDLDVVIATPPTPSPSPRRSGCDPSYPDDRTCIPLGPPFDQGCAITDERRFTVLKPDSQRLDHDEDGIGCEPIR